MGEIFTPQKLIGRLSKLTALLVKPVCKPGKYYDAGGTGQYLRVDQGGAKFWVQRRMVSGKQCKLGWAALL